ncbi:MAG: NTE family protein [Crocinitomix sp.]|jgi:NTE family protein
MKIENLVFEGGGVKGIAYAGALQALETKNILKDVKRVAGTSAGAITAALVSLKYDAATITKVVNNTDFKTFEDHWNPLKIVTKYGLYKGQVLLNFIEKFFTDIGLPNTSTFQDLKDKGYHDLKLFASDLNLSEAREFSVDTTPNAIVAEAVRASMSIPIFFRAWKFSNGIPDEHIYVDGGVTYNYPITCFDKDGSNPQTIGFHFGKLNEPKEPSDLDYDHIVDYVKTVFNMLLDSQKIDYEKDASEKERSVNINDFGISATNFSLTKEEKDKLYNSGQAATLKFLDTYL